MTRAKILVCFPLPLVEIQKQVTRALCTRRTQISPWQVLVVAQDWPSLNLTLPLTQHFRLSLPFFHCVLIFAVCVNLHSNGLEPNQIQATHKIMTY